MIDQSHPYAVAFVRVLWRILMPLVTNRCRKHKNAYPEEECPKCVEENRREAVEEMQQFFDKNAQANIEIISGRLVSSISVEQLFQYFRARLLEELKPIILKVEREQ